MTPQTALKKYFGFSDFRPLQQEIVESALAGRDVLALMPTGAGKSLCYQLPAALLPGVTIVVSPLIALMKDQVDALDATGIPAAYVNSSVTYDEQQSRIHAARSGTTKLLYIAPERLAVPGFLRALSELNVSLFVIDEAHCISEWGHDFRADYRNLSVLRERLPAVPIMALTATANTRVEQDIIEQLRLSAPAVFRASFDRPNLTYQVWPKRGAMAQLVGYLQSKKGEAGIIYCMSRKTTESIAERLRSEGFKAEAYHAGLESKERSRVQENFSRERTDIIVATVAFGMGIDKSNIRFVIHYHLAKSIPAYFQETGRAGRDGLPSDCILFYGQPDRDLIVSLLSEKTGEEFDRAIADLDLMASYAESQVCRRKKILEYFDETVAAENCGNCDNCRLEESASGSFDGTRVAQMFLSCVVRVRERFGAGHVIKVLLGSGDAKVTDFRHHLLPTFGVGKDYTRAQWNDFADQMLRQHLLKAVPIESAGPRRITVLGVTERGREVLLGKRTVMFEQPRKERTKGDSKDALPTLNQELFESLRSLRRRIAEARSVPPYVIFNDATLKQLALKLPRDGEGLLAIPGIGEVRAKEFGAEFLGAIRVFASQNPELQPVAAPAGAQAPKRYVGNTTEVTRQLFARGLSVLEIARERGLASSTITEHIVALFAEGKIESIDHLVPPDRLTVIRDAFRQYGYDTLTPAREALGPDYSWDELKIARLLVQKEEKAAA
jgi:ATP-dependent DNA helicase RecQ